MDAIVQILILISVILVIIVIRHVIDVRSLINKLKNPPVNEALAEKSTTTESAIADEVEDSSLSEKKRNPAVAFGLVILFVCAFFTFFANTIPQVEFHPPKKVEIDANLTGEDLAKLGKQIFEEKGTCLLCHTINGDGSRAPDLAGIGERAGNRKEGYSSEDYLFESLFYPPKYVVDGYAPSMPPMNKPPASLSVEEMTAVIAFLQSMGGEITITAQTKPDFEKIGSPE